MPTDASVLLNRLLTQGKFRHVQVLLQLVEMGSVQRAADAIGVTQSSATQALAALEELLEVQLFERHARGVRPTAACRDLLPAARQLMQGLSDTAEAVAARRQRGQGSVRLMASSAAIQGLLVDALPAFAARHPEIQVVLSEAEGQDQMQAIARGGVDLAVCRQRPVLPQAWTFQPLFADRMAIVCRAGHPLAAQPAPDAATLAAQTWLLMPAGTDARTGFEAMARDFPHPPATYPLVTRALGVVLALLHAQPLCALLPVSVVRRHLAQGSLHAVAGDTPTVLAPIGLLRPRDAGAAATALAEFLAHACAQG